MGLNLRQDLFIYFLIILSHDLSMYVSLDFVHALQIVFVYSGGDSLTFSEVVRGERGSGLLYFWNFWISLFPNDKNLFPKGITNYYFFQSCLILQYLCVNIINNIQN